MTASATKWSGSTRPETKASPSPNVASMAICPRCPVSGFAVKSTPEASAATMRWTATARAAAAGDAGPASVRDGPRGPEARPAFDDGLEEGGLVGDAEQGVLLAGERQVGQVLGGADDRTATAPPPICR